MYIFENDLNLHFKKYNYEKVDYKTFYREIFPIGSFQEKGIYQEGKANGIIIEFCSDNTKKIQKHILTDDLSVLDDITRRKNFCICSAVSYFGKKRCDANAKDLYALVIEIDDLLFTKKFGLQGVDTLFYQMKNKLTPTPTFAVCSGHGIHLYYVFEKPISLNQYVLKELTKLKNALTQRLWNCYVSGNDKIQYEPVCQAFRMVGTTTKINTTTNAYRVSSKITLDYLNSFVPEECQADLNNLKPPPTLLQAKEKYPSWYSKRVEQGLKRAIWTCNKGLYEWWKGQIVKGATCGHRYWCLRMLAIYGMKCNIPKEKVLDDILSFLPLMEERQMDNYDIFTVDDCLSAMVGYDENWATYPIDKISFRTNIPILKNKRNGRTQDLHLKGARAIRDINVANWRENNGRPNKQKIVQQWRKTNPNGTMYQCKKETKLSKNTIKKWWQ